MQPMSSWLPGEAGKGHPGSFTDWCTAKEKDPGGMQNPVSGLGSSGAGDEEQLANGTSCFIQSTHSLSRDCLTYLQ